MFSYARAGRSTSVGRDLERGRPLAERADASTAAGRAQRGTAREREGAFGNAAITAEVRYSLLTKHYHANRSAQSVEYLTVEGRAVFVPSKSFERRGASFVSERDLRSRELRGNSVPSV